MERIGVALGECICCSRIVLVRRVCSLVPSDGPGETMQLERLSASMWPLRARVLVCVDASEDWRRERRAWRDVIQHREVLLPEPLNPPRRLLCGPGPTNVEPSVLAAMEKPMLGHLDPAFLALLPEIVAMLRAVYGLSEGVTLPLQATGMSGMEMGLLSLTEPGDVVIVANAGFFGNRIAQLAARHGARVVEVTSPWGEVVPPEALLEALDAHPEARLLAVVHAETSTGAQYPLEELGAALSGRETLLFADCVTSLATVALAVSEWGVDFAYSCTQKGLSAPPGMSPVAFSERGLRRARSCPRPVPFSFDIELLLDYWVKRPAAYHHTAPILQIYALHEALRCILVEGLEARWARHEAAGRHLRTALQERGLTLLANPAYQLPHITVVRVPEGIDGKRIQQRLLEEHGIEVGGGLGPHAPPMWRIGLMGVNASVEVAGRVIAAFDAVLADEHAHARSSLEEPGSIIREH